MLLIPWIVFVAAWVLVVRFRGKRGRVFGNVLGLMIGLISFFLVAVTLAPKLTSEQKEKLAADSQSRESAKAAAAAEDDLKEKAEAEETARSERVKTEKEKTKDRSLQAALICAGHVESQLVAPKSADFPFGRAAIGSWYDKKNQIYTIKSYVDSQNSYSVMIRTNYLCKVSFTSGDDFEPTNWKLIDLNLSPGPV